VTLAQIRATVATSRDRIHSIYYEAENEGRSLMTPKGVVRRIRTTAAIAPFRRYLEVIHLPLGLDWEDDVDWERTFLTPDNLTIFWVNQRKVLTSSKDANPAQNFKLGPVFNEFFMECTGWWPPGERAEGRRDWAPPPQAVHIILGRADLRLKPGLETVGGHPCAVVSTPDDLDTLWFDVSRGCALVRRHTTNPAERLHACYVNDSFREVAPGVWLPWELSRVAHRGPSPGEIPNDDLLVSTRATRRITSLRINDVPEETFLCRSPPPGTGVETRDNVNGSYMIPGGTDLLDVSVRIGQKILQLRPDYTHIPDKKWGVTRTVGAASGAAAVVILLWVAVRYFRRSPAPGG
jgi:hypothetical protein